MDTAGRVSAAEAARRLGTSIPRVKRAVERLQLPVSHRAGGRVLISPSQLRRLEHELGRAAPAGDLTRVQAAVLAALGRAPMGLVSVRAVAMRAGVSPTAAGRALAMLRQSGLVNQDETWIAAGRARRVELLSANLSSPHWSAIASASAPASRRASRPPGSHRRVPPRLRHLFWNTAASQLDVGHAGTYIARRLLQVRDPEGLAWGARHLTAAAWLGAAQSRGLSPRTRALARNLAADAAPDEPAR